MASWFSCLCLWRSREGAPLLSARPDNIFPPPHTILTAPTARIRPLEQLTSLLRRPRMEDLAGQAHRSYDSRHSHHSNTSSSTCRPLSIIEYSERRREERLELLRKEGERKEVERKRQKDISTTYGSLMCRVDRSVPPTPTYAHDNVAYRRGASTERMSSHLELPHSPPRQIAFSSPTYGAMGIPVGIPSGMSPTPLATPPGLFSTRRTPPGLLVTPPVRHPSAIPPLSPTKYSVPPTPLTPDEKRGREISREMSDSRDSSSNNSRATSVSRTHTRDRVNVVYKEIGLAGLASVPSPKRKRFKKPRRTRISWVDEKEIEEERVTVRSVASLQSMTSLPGNISLAPA